MKKLLIIPMILLIIVIAGFYFVKTNHPIGDRIMDYAGKGYEVAQKALTRAYEWLKARIWPDMAEWLDGRKKAVKQGIEEEKQEFQADIKKETTEMWDRLWGIKPIDWRNRVF